MIVIDTTGDIQARIDLLKSKGVRAVARDYSTRPERCLTRSEAAALSVAGLEIEVRGQVAHLQLGGGGRRVGGERRRRDSQGGEREQDGEPHEDLLDRYYSALPIVPLDFRFCFGIIRCRSQGGDDDQP